METGADITIKEVADLLFAARERIDFYWNFYVVVVIAVIGWLVSVNKTLTRSRKVLVSVAYLIAASMNFLGLYGSYTFAEALRTDLLRMAATSPLTDTRLILEQYSYLSQQLAAFWIHLVVGATILLVVWFARFSESEVAVAKATTGNAEGESSHEKQKGA
ncbi:MAG: hypothetical protein L6R45_05560 [Anaerolineae bacterium]|nr:hypothetical protein [Anaerolineae bacterium]